MNLDFIEIKTRQMKGPGQTRGSAVAAPRIHRAKIRGGWLVTIQPTHSDAHSGIAFVPDAAHEWDGASLP